MKEHGEQGGGQTTKKPPSVRKHSIIEQRCSFVMSCSSIRA